MKRPYFDINERWVMNHQSEYPTILGVVCQFKLACLKLCREIRRQSIDKIDRYIKKRRFIRQMNAKMEWAELGERMENLIIYPKHGKKKVSKKNAKN